jgi:hypothetical protein
MMNKQQFDKVKACVIDCAMYFAKGQPDAPTYGEMSELINSLPAPEVLTMHKQDKEWTRGIMKDDIVCSYFRKHGLYY